MKFPGGKGSTYQTFINLIPPHEVYIESHLGGGAIMRYKRIAKRNIGVEINPKVIEMWENLDQTDLELVNGDAITFLKNYNYRDGTNFGISIHRGYKMKYHFKVHI